MASASSIVATPPGNNTPASNPRTNNDLIPGVISALQNKQNITQTQAAGWLRKAILNITESYPTRELEVVNPPLVQIGPGLGLNGSNYQYSVSYFLQPGDDYTLMEDPVIFLTQTQALTVGLISAYNNAGGPAGIGPVGYPMDYMTPKAIQSLLFVPGGIPYKYTRYGPQFWFGSQPGQPYQVYVPYQQRHKFVQANLPATQLCFPTTWEFVMEIGAALIGAHENRWPDMVKDLRMLLYGDPKNPSEPGLVKALQPQIKRDQAKSTRQLMPMVQEY
jgi:hypothetical protein